MELMLSEIASALSIGVFGFNMARTSSAFSSLTWATSILSTECRSTNSSPENVPPHVNELVTFISWF